jgi:hypothetical protein
MNSHHHSLFRSATALRKPAIALGLITLTALLAISVFAESWENKDWTQWTSQDCYHILDSSPSFSLGSSLSFNQTRSPGHVETVSYSPTAQIGSSLVIRQALERQARLDQHYDKMKPQERQQFDQQANACISENYADRIVVLIGVASPSDLGVFQMFVDGREIPSLPQATVGNTFPCHDAQKIFSVTFRRALAGKQFIQPADKKLELKTAAGSDFTFNLEKMIYKGKLDY